MFNIGDLVVYSPHGICRVDDICEKTILGEKKNYYELHPMEGRNLTISVPVDSDKVNILEILNKEEAEDIIESFKEPGVEWVDIDNHRYEVYSNILKSGERREVAKVANTLLRNKLKVEVEGKKFHEKDKKLLSSIQSVLFTELALSLNTTTEKVEEKILKNIKEKNYPIGR